MNKYAKVLMAAMAAGGMLAISLVGRQVPAAAAAPAATPQVDRGEYLVTIMGCNDCHTPLRMGDRGPEPDMTRMLSGHPAGMPVTEGPDLGAGPWLWAGTATNTAFAGPWGISFAANLTSDKATGLGGWDEATFVRAMQTGRHEGQGRPILPPMPIMAYTHAAEADLAAIFAYLQTVPAIGNRVPQPIEPAAR